MMKLISLMVGTLLTSSLALAGSDFLAEQTLLVPGSNPTATLDRTADNLKSVFEKYQVKLDSSTKIVRPLQVGGTASNPVIKVTLEKCVFFVCRTVDLNAEISIRDVKGNCAKTKQMTGDLSRSGSTLTEVYDRLDVSICLGQSNGKPAVKVTASAHQSPSYSKGMVQGEILKLLQLQIEPIARALNATLKENAQ